MHSIHVLEPILREHAELLQHVILHKIGLASCTIEDPDLVFLDYWDYGAGAYQRYIFLVKCIEMLPVINLARQRCNNKLYNVKQNKDKPFINFLK